MHNTDVASRWEKNMEHLKSGGFGPVEQPQTLLQYWKAQERAGYPYAREGVKYFEEMVEKEKTMCRYCTEYENLPEHIIDGEPAGRIFDACIQKAENGWHITLPSGLDIGIKYCPYCGQALDWSEE